MSSNFWTNFGQFARWLNDRNCIAAFFSLLTIVVLSGALADEQWIYLSGGRCPLNHLGVSLFYGWGKFEYWYTKSISATDEAGGTLAGDDSSLLLTTATTRQHILYKTGRHTYVDCVTPTIVDLFHGLMGVCFIALVCSLAAFFVDVFGSRKAFPVWLQRTSIFSTFTVIICMIVIALTCWVAILVEEQQRSTSDNPENVQTAFEDGFYLVTSAAILSICAVVSNVVKSTLDLRQRLEDRQALIGAENNENLSSHDSLLIAAAAAGHRVPPQYRQEIGSTGPPPPHEFLLTIPPPPPYSP